MSLDRQPYYDDERDNELVPAETVVASVAVEKCLYRFDKLYDYRVPDHMCDDLREGHTVIVPFGGGNKHRTAVVYKIEKRVNYDASPPLKPIIGMSDGSLRMTRELLDLSEWLKEYTFCTYFDAIKAILPPGVTFNIRARYSLCDNGEPLDEDEEELYERLKAAKNEKELSALLDCTLHPQLEKTVKSLIAKGRLEKNDSLRRKIGGEKEQMIRLAEDYEQISKAKPLTPVQRKIIDALENYGAASLKELRYICGVSAASVHTLTKRGITEEYFYEVSRADSANMKASRSPDSVILSDEQQRVFNGISALMDEDEPKCALLRGVTGSGKTSVYIKLIDKALKQGKTALVLVPEISLTPQTVERFEQLFGNCIAIFHSGLSMGKRTDEYERAYKGDAKIVIGTRSAVFAPLDNIGIIVIDEEGEQTYKSDRSPRYSALDAAKQRCFRHKALLLLASATPSIDSYYKSQTGKYTLFTLKERYNKNALPKVYITDMRMEYANGNTGNFSEALANEIRLNLEKGEQTLLLLNRRGFNTHSFCLKCGEVMKCPECELPLTYHKTNNRLMCHLCGYSARMPKLCPKCGGGILSTGTGTQRIEEEIKELFPTARVLRMDADTTGTKNAFSDKFSEFGRGEYDIMVGTQMIAKGLDFENVTLVGVLSIDNALYAGDYLGYERTFSLITQVVGRSGRGNKIGRAYLQTFSPEHYVLKLAARQDYESFYSEEIALRKALIFPPICDICLICFSSPAQSKCEQAAVRMKEIIGKCHAEDNKRLPMIILGPSKMGSGIFCGKYRQKLIIKCKFGKSFRALLNKAIDIANSDDAFGMVQFYVDINGKMQ